jgi:hypothetical protein
VPFKVTLGTGARQAIEDEIHFVERQLGKGYETGGWLFSQYRPRRSSTFTEIRLATRAGDSEHGKDSAAHDLGPVAPKMIEATWSLRVEAAIPRRAGGWGCLEGSKRVHPAPHFRGIHNLQRVELTAARSACHSPTGMLPRFAALAAG